MLLDALLERKDRFCCQFEIFLFKQSGNNITRHPVEHENLNDTENFLFNIGHALIMSNVCSVVLYCIVFYIEEWNALLNVQHSQYN